MAVTYVANIDGTNVASGNWTASGLPAGTQTGDIVVACIAYRNTQSFSVNASHWSLIHQANSGNANLTPTNAIGSLMVAIHKYIGSDPDFVFYRTGGNVARGTLITLRGADIVDTTGNTSITTAASTANNATTPQITTTVTDAFLLMTLGGGADCTASAANAATDPQAADWSEQYDANTTAGADTTLAIATATKASIGATGTFRMLCTANSRHVLSVVEFKPRKPKYMVSG